MSRAVCHAHAEAPAVASCSVCFLPLCDVCRVLDGMVPCCADCLRKERRAPRIRRALSVLAIAAIGGGGYWLYKTYKAPYDYGAHAGEIGKLELQLGNEPCDHPKQIALLERLLAAGDNRGVLDRAAAFAAKCGEEPKMRDTTYLAHKRLGEGDAALSDLTKLIEEHPSSPYYFVWRADIYEERKDLEHAEADLEKALVLYPAATDIPQKLASIYERQGRFCDATVPLQGLVFRYADKPFVVNVVARLAELDQQGACGVTVTGSARVTLQAALGNGMVRTKVRLCDKEDASFLVDTGASFVTMTRALADRLHLDLSEAPKSELRTANGKKTGLFVIVPSVAVQGLKTERVPAVVVDELGPGLDGLLGQSFLSRFEMKQAGGKVELAPRAVGSATPAGSAAPR